ncbi:SulP family inorganic anion transporter [Pelomonas sp. SE-A7]|uniref:SulP family inorganic anion transporter n=1 Tax=Pelomonas sp. SE-A7 TaxID=3054953 RepID=UPI00259CBA6A|nr:SulP family inorganic anion transporter [Pelomonas sp. SE-A7]MDM4764557.1 SulP family inorganic anion transporter [Pelomonas sp. SE-A7]
MVRLHRFRPRLLDLWPHYTRQRFLADLGAGLTVAIVALPLALAFAIGSGVKPEQGLVTAIVAGFLISLLGGSSVQIGGPAGAFIVIVYGIVQRYGLANLLVSTMLAGLLLMGLGALRLGVLVRYIPVGIVLGFTNGIAVLIGFAQLKDLLGLRIAQMPADFFGQLHTLASNLGSFSPGALLLGLASAALVSLWPKSYAMPMGELRWRDRLLRMAAHLPGTLVALLGAGLAAHLLSLPVETIGSRFGEIPRSLPPLAWPELSWQGAQGLVMPTLTIALLGAVESLLCARVADAQGSSPRHDPNQELMAQGVANFVAPLFGGIPATGTMARTVTNLRAGATSPVAGMVHALALLLIVLVAAPLAAHIPLAALAGILLVVAWNMGEWHEFARLRRFSPQYRTILVGSFVLTVVVDLTVAVEVGLVLACLFFVYRMSSLFRVEAAPAGPTGARVIRLHGALFFGAVGKVEGLAEGLAPECRQLVLDAQPLFALDTSGLDALEQLRRDLASQGRRLVICGLAEQPASLVRRGGLADALGEQGLFPDLAAWQGRQAAGGG